MRGHLRERGKDRWQLAVHLGHNRYAYRTIHGTERQAGRELARMIADLDTHGATRGRPTFAQVEADWWELHAPRLAPNTRRGYRTKLDTHIIPALGTTKINAVRTVDLDRLYQQLAAGTRARKPLAPRTIRQIHAIISAICSAAVRWGYLTRSPADHADPPKIPPSELAPPDAAAVRALLAAANTPGLRLAIQLAVATGARRGEICALRWTDVDLTAGELTIARSITHLDDGKTISEKSTKTHQSRTVALDPTTIAALEQYRRTQREAWLLAGHPWTADLHVLATAAGEPWRPDRLTLAFERARKRAKHPTVRFHDLRHFHATELAEAGVPLTVVRDRLGHRDIATTGIYAHGRRDGDRAAAVAIGKILAG